MTPTPCEVARPRTLVVDDVALNRTLIGRMLSKLDHDVTAAQDGEAALEILTTIARPFDLVLLDIEMPKLDGVEVLRRIKADPRLKDLAVVMISRVDDVAVVAQCIELGAEDFLGKPFEPRILQARVSATLAKKRLHDRELMFTLLLEAEEARSERLIASMLPADIAVRLKRGETTIADAHADVSVIFADIVGFSERSAGRDASAVVAELNLVFSLCDELAKRHDLQKIKTIGDAYLAVGGLPPVTRDHLSKSAAFALDLISRLRAAHGIELRVGLHSGPVVAGVIGTTRPAYDVWGDTVNIASRLQGSAPPGGIHVSAEVALRLAGEFRIASRGALDLKGLGARDLYVLTSRR
ncbi:MAG: response regulator [Myxococcales bacterium]|nr:response regulator [Myxococcales bacterium]